MKKVLGFLMAISLLLSATSSIYAFNIFGIDVEINEPSSGDPGNTNNWPEDIKQAIRADQSLAIEKMENSGDACWRIIRSVSGEVTETKVKKSFWKNLIDTLVSLIKKIFGKATDRYSFTGSDYIIGAQCGCSPPRYENDPITGESSRVRIFSVTMDIYNYDRRTTEKVDVDITMKYYWDFLASSWNCTPGNPEGSITDPPPETEIPASALNVSYPQKIILRQENGEVEAVAQHIGASGFSFEAVGTPKVAAEEINKLHWEKEGRVLKDFSGFDTLCNLLLLCGDIQEPEPECDIDGFNDCVNQFNPTTCIETCPFVPIPCPPGTEQGAACSETDPVCSQSCIDRTNSHTNNCLETSHCTEEEAEAGRVIPQN